MIGKAVIPIPVLHKYGLLDSSRVLNLPVDSISPNPHQPRRVFSQQELDELAHSIQTVGLLQPLTVRKVPKGWELVAGERRLRAAKMAGLDHVPCLCVHVDSESSSLLALVENLQRKNLDFWDEALALQNLMDEFSFSQEELAHRVGKSPSAVANKLRLLKLSPDVLALLRDGGFTERHARALLRLPTPELQQQAAQQIAAQSLTVARTEEVVQHLLTPPSLRKRPIYVIKDVRLFLNTLSRSMDLMRSAGVDAQCLREDREDSILLTIQIPRHPTHP